MQVDAPIYSLEGAAERAVALEALGFDGVFTFEGPHDVFVPLVLAAAATELRTWSNVAIAFPRNPIHLAHTARDLQALSGGRFNLGLGTQVRTHVERRFGSDFDRPVERMSDLLAALRAIFATWQDGTRLQHEGPYYRHDLMTPMFDPGPSEWGAPPLHVGALGPRLTEMVAAEADGLLLMPFTSRRFFETATAPAIEAGLARRDPALGPLEVVPELIVCAGRDDDEQAVADAGCRALLGFYGSTPAYRGVLEAEGYGDLQPELRDLSRQGRWDEMATLIDDPLLEAVAVRGTPTEVAEQIAARFGDRAGRVAVYLPYDAPDGVLSEVAEELHAR
ncbi:MAG: TIGR03617 family F420-dependent LLM class oxidoreductase [Microthrixaceae bacterium]|nr:TIGR03617 family F420-dependent LLM class oxidoreductase [Microthrixaceae bacterium]MCB9387174.1 TIGR03617 family F420-dependent LLM class oxidoreductase [Microthrixaceae bacterium]MCO5321719.1 TIGR03617 family F420-dependent LLM class oxidoreductase [Microthrixaceae bacterium]